MGLGQWTMDSGSWTMDLGQWTLNCSRERGKNMTRDYKKIVAWQRAHQLTLKIYKETKAFPPEERFSLTSQLRRAAYSVPSNIVEGSGRGTKKEYLRFLYIALASLKEAEYFLLLSHDLGYLHKSDYEELTHLVNSTFGPLQGLMKSVKKETGIIGNLLAIILSGIIVNLSRGHLSA